MIGDVDDTIECSNCGHANPAWAQVCRNCGVSLRRDLARPVSRPQTPFPTDQQSLVSMGAGVVAIVLAIALGLFLSAINPTEPTVGVTTSPSPTASPTAAASQTAVASTTSKPSPTATPKLAGTLTFGTGLNRTTKQVTNPTSTFRPGGLFAYSVATTQPFGTTRLAVEVSRVASGKETVVDPRSKNPVTVSASAKIFGIVLQTSTLISDYGGGGDFVMRVYRGNEKVAEGRFTLSAS